MTGPRDPHCACVQTLEPRRLLSAALPALTGTFVGTAGVAPAAADLTIVVASENRSGRIVGTFTETSSGSVNTRNFAGTVNSRGKVVLHIKKQVQVQGHFVIHPETVNGTLSSDANTLAGTTVSGGFHGV